ncbi:cyclin-dependent kinase inhibitor 1 isoform X2 [Genypterus blacodes]
MALHKRILSSLGNGPTRRSLFGPVDREQLQVEYRASLQKDLEEASQRWGFDFFAEKPLNGSNFKWEGVPSTKVPLLYRSSTSGVRRAKGHSAAEETVTPSGDRAESPQNDKENIPLSPDRCSLKLEKTPEKCERRGLKRKQTNITDFYQAKRKVAGMPLKSSQ